MANNNAFKVNTFQNLKTHLIICENIFENSSQIREHALQEYNYSTRKAFGYVCNWGFISADILMIFCKLLKLNIRVKSFHYLFIPNGLDSYPHTDDKPLYESTHFCLAAVIYLNPNIDKINYTSFYETFDENGLNIRPSEITSFVGNRYNKCVMYDGSVYHSPGSGFGNDLDNPQDIRLTATYFLDAYHYKKI